MESWSVYIYKTERELMGLCREAWLGLIEGQEGRNAHFTMERSSSKGVFLSDPGSDGRSISTLSRREVYRNHWMRVREDEILRSNGQRGIYGVVEKDDAAIILPIDREHIWLVEQFRYPIEERALELPQGGWEMEIDDPEELARGELREEMGLEAARMNYLGWLWIAYGFTRQRQHVFVATGLSQVAKQPDAEEHDLVVHCLPITEFEERIRSGRIRDNCTVSAWGLYLLWNSGKTAR
jgi:8-oxo-dGTP pyrophosphatase MutT (NUDIX family)